MESWSHIDDDLKVQLMISSDCEAEISCWCHLLKLLCGLEWSAAALGHTVPPRAWLLVGCLSNSSSSGLAWTRWGGTRDARFWACSPGQGFKCLTDWTGWRGNWTSESSRMGRSSDPDRCERKEHLQEQAGEASWWVQRPSLCPPCELPCFGGRQIWSGTLCRDSWLVPLFTFH